MIGRRLRGTWLCLETMSLEVFGLWRQNIETPSKQFIRGLETNVSFMFSLDDKKQKGHIQKKTVRRMKYFHGVEDVGTSSVVSSLHAVCQQDLVTPP